MRVATDVLHRVRVHSGGTIKNFQIDTRKVVAAEIRETERHKVRRESSGRGNERDKAAERAMKKKSAVAIVNSAVSGN